MSRTKRTIIRVVGDNYGDNYIEIFEAGEAMKCSGRKLSKRKMKPYTSDQQRRKYTVESEYSPVTKGHKLEIKNANRSLKKQARQEAKKLIQLEL